VRNLSHYLSEPIDEIEEFYLFQYIISSGIEEQSFELYSDGQLKIIFDDAIDFVSRDMNLDFSNLKEDKSFFNHFRVMLYRNKNKIIIVNNLLGEMKKEYTELFESVKKMSGYLSREYSLNTISEDETGFNM
ncbi:PRD domain-containing protein, partial [Salmonella enterica subsp. enterica serovar Montevideo]|nr:PRD domain-containing protein [Salmonella enterica subsp. enterica serovar Montevideo]